MADVQILLRLTTEERDALLDLAQRERRTVSAQLRVLIGAAVERPKK